MQETFELTERQRTILRRVVEEFVGTGQPVGSKTLVERSDLRVSASTVRAELAELEQRGLLTHPHTSAGRVPTERGYRYYADELLGRLEPHPPAFPLDLTATSTEVEAALQATTEMLSQVTRLLALVSAPPLEATHVRHVEVLLLQPQLVMVVVITSAGGVSKRLSTSRSPSTPGWRSGRATTCARPWRGSSSAPGCSAGASRTRGCRPPSETSWPRSGRPSPSS